MQRLRNLVSGRHTLLFVAFLVAASAAVLLVPASTQADPTPTTRCGTEIIYYDWTGKNVIGMRGWTSESCGCNFYGWGQTSGNRTFDCSYC